MKQSNPQSSKDACSVSPTLPIKQPPKVRRGSMSCPKKHKRSLFQNIGKNILPKWVQGRHRKHEEGPCRTFSVGPFELKVVNARQDIALLEFIFMQRPLTEQESRLVVLQRDISFPLKKYLQQFLKSLFDICD